MRHAAIDKHFAAIHETAVVGGQKGDDLLQENQAAEMAETAINPRDSAYK
ncbi:hypothetical protein ACIPL1_16750 [Pseudomonas sp. NPDC090202]